MCILVWCKHQAYTRISPDSGSSEEDNDPLFLSGSSSVFYSLHTVRVNRAAMAIVENSVVDLGRSFQKNPPEDSGYQDRRAADQQQKLHLKVTPSPPAINHHHFRPNGGDFDLQRNGDAADEKLNRNNMRELQDLFSKLNPWAEAFVPPSLANGSSHGNGSISGSVVSDGGSSGNGFLGRRKRTFNQGKRRVNSRTSMAQREEIIRRTVYVSDIDHQVTEEQLAALFVGCGQVVDCRICGDPNSVLRFAFIEFTDQVGARTALNLSGTMLGFYPVKVLPSKTAIAPVNPTYLPRTEDEREMCSRTIYCTNIDKKVTQADLKLFFESLCGEVYRLRLLGDYHHSTRIAFVEFIMAESAIAALNCSGVVLGSLPLRVSPSKTPVRPRSPRPPIH